MPIYRQADSRLGRRHMAEWRRRALRAVMLLLLILAGCTAGLVALDSASAPIGTKVIRAIWNSANLITTLGDFSSFDERQRAFMLGAMFFATIAGGYALTQLTGLLSSDAVLALRENRIVQQRLQQLEGHVIVLGFGPLGVLVARRLKAAGETVVVLEKLDTLAEQASELGYLVVNADAGANDAALKLAGVDRARAFVVTTDDPDRKVAVTLMAHALNPKLKIAVTGANEQRGALLHRAGASEVVIAEDLIAGALVERLASPKAKR